MTRRMASGSSLSPRDVDPATSEKTMVMVFRVSATEPECTAPPRSCLLQGPWPEHPRLWARAGPEPLCASGPRSGLRDRLARKAEENAELIWKDLVVGVEKLQRAIREAMGPTGDGCWGFAERLG
jgi:hypothetical protein